METRPRALNYLFSIASNRGYNTHFMVEFFIGFIDLFLHLDQHLNAVIANYGVATYILLFAIVFCETGLVVTPILPGDSLLFAAGAFAASGSLDVRVLCSLLFIAAVLGDALNYAVGYRLGPKVLTGRFRFLKHEYLDKTEQFFRRYGKKTIMIARFIPIVRTFAPFMAGVGQMQYRIFAVYNILGALLWVAIFVLGGYYFGNIPAVKRNFTLVIAGIIFVSVLPAVVECARVRLNIKKSVNGSV